VTRLGKKNVFKEFAESDRFGIRETLERNCVVSKNNFEFGLDLIHYFLFLRLFNDLYQVHGLHCWCHGRSH
jgi:hypothetical protein